MKKLVDSNFDPHEVIETNPLKEEKKPVVTKGNSAAKKALIIGIIFLILTVIGYIIYNYQQNKDDGSNGK